MGTVVKLRTRHDNRSGATGKAGGGSVIAYPGINMREVEKMFQYIKRSDAKKTAR